MSYKETIPPEERVIREYLRVSSQRQEKEGTIKTQAHTLRRMVQGKFGVKTEIQKSYVDDGYSGTQLDRPGLDELRADLADDSWNTLVLFSGDRLSRDFNHADQLMQEIAESGKEVFYADGSSPTHNSKLVNRVLSAVDDDEREKILRRLREGKRRRAEQDKAINHSTPAYGYKLVPKRGTKASPDFEQTRLEIIKSEAAIVRKMFDLVGNKRFTVPQLILWLKERGIKPRRSARGVWNTSTLYSLLKNETYIGKARFGSSVAVEPDRRLVKKPYYKVKKTSRRMKPKEEWVYIPVPAILTGKKGIELFERVQKQLSQNRRMAAGGEWKGDAYLFANLMHCECGYTRNGSGSAAKKNIYYTCSSRKSCFPDKPCESGGVNARVADEHLWNKLAEALTDPLELTRGVKSYYEMEAHDEKAMSSEISILLSNIEELEKKQERIEQAYEAGAYNATKLVEKLKPVEKNLEAAKSKMTTLLPSKTKEDTKPDDDLLSKIIAYAPDALRELDYKQKREIVLESVSKVITVPGMATIYGSVPVQEGILLNRPKTLKLKGNKATIASPFYVYLKTISRHCWLAQRRKINVI